VGNAVFDDNAEKVGAKNSQDAADYGANQALQAHNPQAYLKPNHEQTDDNSSQRRSPRWKVSQPKRAQMITGYSYNRNENDTNNSQVHKDPPDWDHCWL